MNLLHGFGLSADYTRLVRLETQIANTVLERMIANDYTYIPNDFVLGRYVFFAADNADFAEDTPDGKNTLHAAVMTIYQRCHPTDVSPNVELAGEATSKCLKEIPEPPLLQCKMPSAPKPQSTDYPHFIHRHADPYSIEETTWLIGKSLVRQNLAQTLMTVQEYDQQESATKRMEIPTWSAYNSLIAGTVLPKTRIGTPPLIPFPAHEWPTLLTILKQAQNITTKVVGPGRKTVITLDLGLYKPAKQLQMHRDDLGDVILRTGELHMVMAQLRTIGAYIEGSGIDQAWIEAGLYSSVTVKQILDGKHVKRGMEAHLITLQCLFGLYTEAFCDEYPTVTEQCTNQAQHFNEACSTKDPQQVKESHRSLINCLAQHAIMEKLTNFREKSNAKPLFQMVQQYMDMVIHMLQFTKATRTGDWILHLESADTFTKFFFAHDKQNYARLIPLYLADMNQIQIKDPEVWNEFMEGNWVVNKNGSVSFCAIGADHALEQVNRTMKVTGGLVGITQNHNARSKFFLVSPELAKLTSEAEDMAGLTNEASKHHHELTQAFLNRQEKCIETLSTTFSAFTNPFTEDCDDLINIVTKAVAPVEIQTDICKSGLIGMNKYKEFVSQRIVKADINLWAPMKKLNLKMWTAIGKQTKVRSGDKVIELKEDRSLFARMLIVCKSRPEINLQDAIGVHEFSVVPRSLFASDGSLLFTYGKSELMHILEGMDCDEREEVDEQCSNKVAVVDGMAEVQCLQIEKGMKTFSHLAQTFVAKINVKYGNYGETHVVFDRYDVDLSL